MASAKAGDRSSYRELLARHQAAAFRAAYLSAGSSAEASAATQRACAEAWSALRRVPSNARFGPWLALLAARAAQEPARQQRRAPRSARRMKGELVRAAELERRLQAASVGVEFPAAPDVVESVISQLPERRCRAEWAPRAIATAGGLWVVAAVLVVAIAGGAIAFVSARGGLSGAARPALREVSAPASSPAPPPLAALPSPLAPAQAAPDLHSLGVRIPLTRARHAAGFTALLPPAASAAYLGRDIPGGRLSLLAGSELITEFRGATIPYILTLIGPGSHAELTWVNGSPGVYGFAARASGAGAVLTWLQGPLTLRIEGAQTLEQALALARSLR